MIKDAILNSFRKKEKIEKKDEYGKWKYPMYWAIDLHDVIIPGTYTRNNEGRQFYPDVKEVLQWLTNRKDMCLILYTSSHEDSIQDIIKWIAEYGIRFDYVNKNPECSNSNLCCFKDKFYMDILLEDKAGFVGETDWTAVKNTLIEINQWQKKDSHNDLV